MSSSVRTPVIWRPMGFISANPAFIVFARSQMGLRRFQFGRLSQDCTTSSVIRAKGFRCEHRVFDPHRFCHDRGGRCAPGRNPKFRCAGALVPSRHTDNPGNRGLADRNRCCGIGAADAQPGRVGLFRSLPRLSSASPVGLCPPGPGVRTAGRRHGAGRSADGLHLCWLQFVETHPPPCRQACGLTLRRMIIQFRTGLPNDFEAVREGAAQAVAANGDRNSVWCARPNTPCWSASRELTRPTPRPALVVTASISTHSPTGFRVR
jgi:hypothetical protein